MKRIDTSTRAVDLFGAGKDGFKDGNLAGGIVPTDFNADWPNGVQEELVALIESSGQAASGADLHQVLGGVKRIAAAGVRTTVTASIALTPADAGVVRVDATAGNVVITLPSAAALMLPGAAVGASVGFCLERIDSSGNTVSVVPAGAHVFQPGNMGAAALASNPCHLMAGEVLSLWSDGVSNWHGAYLRAERIAVFPTPGSTSWTCPPFTTRVHAKGKAGGGGAGAAASGTSSTGGGGGGGYAEGVYAVVPNTSYPVTVGNAGTGGPQPTTSGGTGGASSFASFFTCNGGVGSAGANGTANPPGAGGNATGGQLNVPGLSGEAGEVLGGTYRFGSGGASMWVGPSRGTGMYPGGGGAGAVNGNGSPGAAGIIILKFGA